MWPIYVICNLIVSEKRDREIRKKKIEYKENLERQKEDDVYK